MSSHSGDSASGGGTRGAGGGATGITVEYVPDEPDFIDAEMLVLRARLRRNVQIYLLYGLALGALAAVLRAEAKVTVLLLLLAGTQLLNALWARYGTLKRLGDAWRSTSHLDDPVRVTLGDDGLRRQSEAGHAFLRWRVFTHYRETPTLLVLFCGYNVAEWLPKRALTAEQLPACRALLYEKIGRTEYRPREQGRGFAVVDGGRPSPVEILEERQPPGA